PPNRRDYLSDVFAKVTLVDLPFLEDYQCIKLSRWSDVTDVNTVYKLSFCL
ncbi:hypothetical protein JYU34_022351, partial [Plutella xylostella]